MPVVTLNVNGASHEVDIDPSTPLLYVLRNDLGLQGPRFGCGLAQCGACTVIVDGVAVRSCVTPVAAVSGAITTLEGLAQNGRLDPLQQAWIDEQVPQCGYCQNGQIMTARALLNANPNPTDAEIRAGMEGVLCRCMTYYRVQKAIKRAARETAAASFRDEAPGAAPESTAGNGAVAQAMVGQPSGRGGTAGDSTAGNAGAPDSAAPPLASAPNRTKGAEA